MTHPLIEAYRLAVLHGRTTEPDIAAYEAAEDNLARALAVTQGTRPAWEQMIANRDEFIANKGLWAEFSAYLAQPASKESKS